jgi:hypothetical protein
MICGSLCLDEYGRRCHHLPRLKRSVDDESAVKGKSHLRDAFLASIRKVGESSGESDCIDASRGHMVYSKKASLAESSSSYAPEAVGDFAIKHTIGSQHRDLRDGYVADSERGLRS